MDNIIKYFESRILTIQLNRPDVHNALDNALVENLQSCIENAAQDENIRVIILKSNGKNFSAGADLNQMKQMKALSYDENVKDAQKLAHMIKVLYECPKPTIACLHGKTFGGGNALVAASDYAIAHPMSSFCFSEVRLGLIPAVISPFITKVMGERNTKQWFMSGSAYGADAALAAGLITHLSENPEAKCQEIAEQLLQQAPGAQQQIKPLVHKVASQEIDETTLLECAHTLAKTRISDEAQFGLKLFLEKKPISWNDKP